MPIKTTTDAAKVQRQVYKIKELVCNEHLLLRVGMSREDIFIIHQIMSKQPAHVLGAIAEKFLITESAATIKCIDVTNKLKARITYAIAGYDYNLKLRTQNENYRQKINELSLQLRVANGETAGVVDAEKKLQMLASPLEDLALPTSLTNLCYKIGLKTIGDLCEIKQSMLLKYRGFGPGVIKKINDSLSLLGLYLKK